MKTIKKMTTRHSSRDNKKSDRNDEYKEYSNNNKNNNNYDDQYRYEYTDNNGEYGNNIPHMKKKINTNLST